jgi:pilus assembly protein CpaB
MDRVNKKILIISILLAAFTSFLAYIYIKNVTSRQETVEYVTVYVAAKTLPARHKITDGDLAEAKVTREYLNPKAVLNKADIVGKRLKDSVIEGEQILRDRLVGNSDLTLAYNIPEGMRAVSININDQSNVSHLVRPGDFVDVIASFESEEEEEGENRKIYPRITKIVLPTPPFVLNIVMTLDFTSSAFFETDVCSLLLDSISYVFSTATISSSLENGFIIYSLAPADIAFLMYSFSP